jgi:hypothetical protein
MKMQLKNVKEGLLFAFIISCFVGSGVSYGKIYAFHVLLLPTFVVSVFSFFKESLWLNKIFLFVTFLFLYVILISLINKQLKHLPFYTIGYFIFFILFSNKELIIRRRKNFFKLILILFVIHLLIGLGEMLQWWRYPISKYSEWNHLFSRQSFNPSLSECFDISYALSSPTGFHWNENDYGIVLCLFSFLLLFIKNKLIKSFFLLLAFSLIIATASKIGFYAFLILSGYIIIVELIKKNRWIIIPLLSVVFVLSDGFYLFPTQNKKIKEVAWVSQSIFKPGEFPSYCFEKMSSKDTRLNLTKLGINLSKENLFFGLGAGGFAEKIHQKNIKSESKKDILIENPHNFLLELIVDFGYFFMLMLFILIIYILALLKKKNQTKLIFTFLVLLIVLVPVSAMSSSLMYFLPFYLFLSLGLTYFSFKIDV